MRGKTRLYIFIICSIFPESARWLIIHGRVKQCEESFQRIAQINGREWPENIDLQPLVEVSYWSLFMTGLNLTLCTV